mgnify:CR=1 FL=1|jgi:hypothetical protein
MSWSDIMMENIRYYIERTYPYLLAGIVVILVVINKVNVMGNNDFKEALNGIVTLDSIILGFLGAIMPVILSMKNESKFVKYVFQNDKKHLFVRYLKSTVFMGLINAVFSLCMHLRGSMSKNIKFSMYYIWIFTAVAFLVLTYRCMSYMIVLVFRPDDGEIEKNENQKKTVITDREQRDLKDYYK